MKCQETRYKKQKRTPSKHTFVSCYLVPCFFVNQSNIFSGSHKVSPRGTKTRNHQNDSSNVFNIKKTAIIATPTALHFVQNSIGMSIS